MKNIFIGDIDEFYCDGEDGDNRWAVWSSETVLGKKVEKLLGRFFTEKEAVEFAKTQGYKAELYDEYYED